MKLEFALKNIVSGISNSYGETFFNLITTELGKAVGADYCFIARVDDSFTTSRTIATFAHGKIIENFEYELKNTPCELVVCKKISFFPRDVISLFPKDLLLQEMNIEAYVGASLKDMTGRVMGLVVALFHSEIKDFEDVHTLFELFTGRIEAEIDRLDKQKKLEDLSTNLQERVNIATKRLVEQEKFASLGQLVAGVSHEINTPLGVGVTATSILIHTLTKFSKEIKEERLTQKGLDEYLVKLHETTNILQVNLFNAAKLIKNFKKVAVGQSNLQMSKFNLRDMLKSIVESLDPMIKKLSLQIRFDMDENIIITSYQSDYFQIFNNLVLNTIIHAFEGRTLGLVIIKAENINKFLRISVKDNGIGISENNIKNIFDPFFTTKRGSGGTGLGLNIVHNTVVQKLHGRINVVSAEDNGTEFLLELPIDLT